MLTILTLLAVPYVDAAQSGTVRGTVTDDSGLGIPRASIVISGPGIAGELVVESDDEGNFRFLNVPVGRHDMRILKTGFAPMERKVTVRLDESAFVAVELVFGQEVVVIEEALPVIDTTRTAVSTELSKEVMDTLPTGRDYTTVVNMVPGVYGRIDTEVGGSGGGTPSVRGEGAYGNNYQVDGISTRDPATKEAGSDVSFDAIETIQVYTDGAPAEFGQMTGMLVNVVTKDGGDEHHGSGAYYLDFDASSTPTYEILDTDKGKEVETAKPDFMTHSASVTAGGPIAKEKLWYFAALDFDYDQSLGAGVDPSTPSTFLGGGGFGKLTWFVSPDVVLRYQLSGSLYDRDNASQDPLYAPEAQDRVFGDELGHLLQAVWRPALQTELDLKVVSVGGHDNDVPMSGDHEAAQVTDGISGEISGNYGSFDINTRQRTGFVFSITQLADHALGSHRVKGGIEGYSISQTRDLDFTGPGEGVSATSLPGDTCSAENEYYDCYLNTRYTGSDPLSHSSLTLAAYLQDDWQPWDFLTVNAGARIDHEELYTSEGLAIVDQWMPAPRIGISWDVTRDSKTKLFLNAGQYYDVSGTSLAEWGDQRTAYGFDVYNYNNYYYSQGAYPLVYCNEASLSQLSDEARDASEAICNGELRPYHLNKMVVGAERELFANFAVGVRGILSETVDIPEDMNWDYDYWVITNPESKRRDYHAIEVTAEKKLADHWQLMGAYTWSEALGTLPGQFEQATGSTWGGDGDGVGVYGDDIADPDTRAALFDAGYGAFVEGFNGLGSATNTAGYYGYLPYDSTHQVKLNASYEFTIKKFETTVGAIYEFDSGHAWQKRGYVANYGDYDGYPEGRGTRRMPAVHYLDMRFAEAFEFNDDRSVELAVDVFNVLDLDQVISYYENDNDMFGMVYYRQSPRSIRASLKVTY